MMKVSELMVGDWVKSPHGNIAQVVEIVCEETTDGNFEYFVTLSDTFDFHISEIEPIALTAEILEKNGFNRNNVGYNGICYQWSCGELVFASCFSCHNENLTVPSWFMMTIVNNELDYRTQLNSNCNFPCAYVHQLQHAMGICGIEKEIIL